MSAHDQGIYDVRCEWGPRALQHLAPAHATIIVDVLSFTTCVVICAERRSTVVPFAGTHADAATHARSIGAVAANPQRGETPSLSPASLTTIAPNTRLLLPSPNGSTLAEQAGDDTLVLAGCLRNASAIGPRLERHFTTQRTPPPHTINVIPAGERWPDGTLRPAIEDWIGAGAIIRSLPGTTSPEARLALHAFETTAPSLLATLRDAASGRELIERNFPQDVELAAELDASNAVPSLQHGCFVNALSPTTGAHE